MQKPISYLIFIVQYLSASLHSNIVYVGVGGTGWRHSGVYGGLSLEIKEILGNHWKDS